MTKKTAVVVGGLGVIGRNLIHYLTPFDDWDIISLARRPPDFDTLARFISVDLLDRDDAEAKLGGLNQVTHIFFMADKEPLWSQIVAKYDLQRIPYRDVAAWAFADYVFGCDWDVMTDTLKIRRAGFPDCVDSEEMFLRLFRQFRDAKIIP